MSRFAASLSALLLLHGSVVDRVEGHGHMTSPRSLNWYAAEEGLGGYGGGGQVGVPPQESCPHCLNANEGVCGKVSNGGRSYDPFLDSTGQVMPWITQDTYTEGQVISVKSYLDTHHNGHMTLSACPMGLASTQACFDKEENFLTFVADITPGTSFPMPADPNYPERGMYYGGQGGGIKSFEMLFKLPEGVGIHGDQVMLQWRYITANSCSPPGYAEYFSTNSLPNSFWTSGLTLCTPPYPSDGTRSTTWPEQFFNCAEVAVTPLAPTPAPPPTNAPPPTEATPTSPVSSPVAYPPTSTSGGPGCCSRDFKNCNEQLVGWCSESQANCEGPCDKYWLPNGAITGCTARYESCNVDSDCCSPGVCKSGQCEIGEYGPSPTSPTPPGPAPTPQTSTGPSCCTQDFKVCVSWCGTTESDCTGCNNDQVHWYPIETGTDCVARDAACTNNVDGCCAGLICQGDQYHAQCVVDPNPAPAPTPAATTTTTTTSTPAPAPTEMMNPSCYSFNYRDCNHPDAVSNGGGSCAAVFLPNGAEQNCLALWDGGCTNDAECCLDLVCYDGGSPSSQCVESAALPFRKRMLAEEDSNNNASSSTELLKGACIVCDDVPARDMTESGVDCSSLGALGAMCKEDGNWLANRFCRRSCFEAGFGYDGDVCCTEGAAASRLLRKSRS